jgi:hypothetical protein
MNIRKKRYPIVNAKIVTLLSFLTILLTLALVFLIGHKTVFLRLEITLAIISICLFIFLFTGLYIGIRIQHEPIFKEKWRPLKSKWDTADLFSLDTFGITLGEGIIGILLSMLLWIVLSIAIIILLIIIANMLWGVIFILGVMLYWLFYKAYRYVFKKSRLCRHRIGLSLKYSLLFTILYTGWIYL